MSVAVEVFEVASGVFLVVGAYTNWCLVREDEAITLVDAAWPKSLDRLAPLAAGTILPGHGSAMQMPIAVAVD